jgi:geranylgeranyl diphosphate synthase type II
VNRNGGMAGPDHVQVTLDRYSRLTRAAMEEFLVERRPDGYLYDLVRDYPSRAGKGIRPALLIATCQAYGGSVREGLAPAVALEMLHNAFLIHDDLEDASRVRRGAPTLHEAHGVALAVNAGDALAALALEPLHEDGVLGTRLSQRVVGEFLRMIRQTTEGQALELGWRRHNVVDLRPADYLRLTSKKTCCYTTVSPLRVGALVGSRGVSPLRALSRFGFYLGIAFQIRDDLLNLIGSGDVHGKERLGDIHEGKRTLMLVHLLAEADESDRAWLIDYLAAPASDRASPDAERVLQLMRRYGSLEFAREYGRGMVAAARDAFGEAFAEVPESPHLDFIRGLIPYVLGRSL